MIWSKISDALTETDTSFCRFVSVLTPPALKLVSEATAYTLKQNQSESTALTFPELCFRAVKRDLLILQTSYTNFSELSAWVSHRHTSALTKALFTITQCFFAGTCLFLSCQCHIFAALQLLAVCAITHTHTSHSLYDYSEPF